MFLKGDNFLDFLFAYLQDKDFPNWGLVLKDLFAPMGATSFPYEMTPIYTGGKNENERVAFPENVPYHLKLHVMSPCSAECSVSCRGVGIERVFLSTSR